MKPRVSAEGGRKEKTCFIENSDDPDFFEGRRRSMKSKGVELRKLKIEESLLDRDKHAARWAELVESGELKSE